MDVRQAVAVTPHQRAYFDAFGFLLLPGLLADDIVEITKAFEQVFAEASNPRWEMRVPGYRNHSRVAMPDFIDRHPTLAKLASDPRTLGAATDLLGSGCEFVESDGNVFLCESEWHYDTPARGDLRNIKLSLYLDPLDRDSGAPRVMPTTHLQESIGTSKLAATLGFDGAIEERLGLGGEHLPSWTLENAPGDLIVWDFRLLHASYGSVAPRRLISMNFRGA
jgi:hypothetical protein